MNCPRCEKPLPDDALRCLHCGAPSGPAAYGSAYLLDDAALLELEQLVRHDTIGEYEIGRELGRGGMAVVYLATEIALARQVAIKVLPPMLIVGKGAVERFKREAMVAASLAHANIIPIYRISSGGRLFWYAMKYVQGRSLADLLLEQSCIPLDQAIRILEQIASALDYAHERGVIHRDVKPANMMIDGGGRVMVTDFGIAKVVEASAAASGVVMGTPLYMSAEQGLGEVLTGAADQYSLGVMAYHMLSGRVPFDGDTIVDIVRKHCIQDPPPLESVCPGLPPEVCNAIRRTMAKTPGERFPSVGAFVGALKGPANAPTIRLGRRDSAALYRAVTGRTRGWRWWVGAAVVATLAVAALPTANLWQRDRPVPLHPSAPAASPLTEVAPPPLKRAAPAARAPGALIIQTVGGWARISIDGEFRREGTSYREAAKPGRHRVQLAREGYLPVDTSVTLRTRDTLVLRLIMQRGGS